jgi:hypothetical protein
MKHNSFSTELCFHEFVFFLDDHCMNKKLFCEYSVGRVHACMLVIKGFLKLNMTQFMPRGVVDFAQ